MKKADFDRLSKYDSNDIEQAIDRWVILRKHSERNRKILKRHLIDGICFEPLAEEFDMSVRQIKNVVYRTEEQLLKHL